MWSNFLLEEFSDSMPEHIMLLREDFPCSKVSEMCCFTGLWSRRVRSEKGYEIDKRAFAAHFGIPCFR